jgi:cell division protein FtsZ
MEARRAARPAEEDRGPLSLLRRLASVGLGRRDDDHIGTPAARPEPQIAVPPRSDPRPASRTPAPIPAQARAAPPPRPAPQQDPLYRPAQGDLDPHGRSVPRDVRLQEDDLEIPAFLRRQAN